MSNDSSCGTKTCGPGTNKNKFISGLKFSSININSIRGKKLELLAFLDLHQPQIVAIQETKIDNTISTSELFPETCPYNVYRKDRTLDGGGVMLLIHKDIPRMPITELENGSESVLVKVFANKTSHFVASWYRPPDVKIEELELFKDQLEKVKTSHKGNKPPSVHVLGDFNFRDIVWPDRLNKHGFSLSVSEGAKTSRSVSSVPWLTPEIRRKIRRKNETHAKAKKTGSAKFRTKFETLRREIKADIRKQHELYVNNLVGDVKANPRDFYRYIKSEKKCSGYPPFEKAKWKWSC